MIQPHRTARSRLSAPQTVSRTGQPAQWRWGHDRESSRPKAAQRVPARAVPARPSTMSGAGGCLALPDGVQLLVQDNAHCLRDALRGVGGELLGVGAAGALAHLTRGGAALGDLVLRLL